MIPKTDEKTWDGRACFPANAVSLDGIPCHSRGSGVSIKRGIVEQLIIDGRRGGIQAVGHGAQDLYLVPFLALRELSSKYRVAGRIEGRDAFAHRPRLERFIGYEPDSPVIRVVFDPETHLLAEVAFLVEDSVRMPVRYLYSDYTSIEGVAVARRVEQWEHLGRTEIIVAATVLKSNLVVLKMPCGRIFAISGPLARIPDTIH